MKSKQSMLQAGFKLRKWKSNIEELREHIANNESQEHKLPRIKDSEKASSEPGKDNTTVLGIDWDVISDKLEVNIDKMKIDGTIITKKLLLSSIAKIFDPLGPDSPVTVIDKAIFRIYTGLSVTGMMSYLLRNARYGKNSSEIPMQLNLSLFLEAFTSHIYMKMSIIHFTALEMQAQRHIVQSYT